MGYNDDRFGGGRGGGGFGGPRQMFDVICSDCGKPAQVPFKPMEGRPVYCRDCYMKHKGDRGSSY